MDLDERKEKILKAIIQTYLETGEPVGSRTISKYSDLNLSSATIRNEMSDLEDLGYIIQPHTSAGRIPSDKGYRFYVNQIIEEKNNEVTEIKDMMIQRVDRVELVLKQMASLLAANTNYATMISGPKYHQTKLKFIQLSKVEKTKLLIVIVVEGNIIKNSIVNIGEELSDESILNLDLVLNEVAEAIHANDEDLQIYTSGTTNIFKYPELADGQKASQLISTLEQKELLKGLFEDEKEGQDPGTEIQVYIGDEMPVQTMKDCSIVTANYVLGEGLRGTIGIIGPKRMDYEKVVNTLRTMMNQLETTFKNEER